MPYHRRYWIFDLDGTLTVSVHDFDGLRAQLDLPVGVSILDGIGGRPHDEQPQLLAAVEAWEWAHVESAEAAPDAVALLDALGERPLAILTRNTRPIALRTLAHVGLLERFDSALVLGRDEARPKPDPEGIEWILSQWGAKPADAVMVGDHRDDLVAGRAAGVATIHVARNGESSWPEVVDLQVSGLDAVAARLR